MQGVQQWYMAIGGHQVGPVSQDEILANLRNGSGADFDGTYTFSDAGADLWVTADGIVGRAQRLGGYGNYVEVEHGNAIQTRYGHMSSYVVIPGQSVKKGDVLGYVGSTGRSTGSHLHYEVRIAGEPVNPTSFLEPVTNMSKILIASKDADSKSLGGPAE